MIDGVPDDFDETLVRNPRESAAVLLDRLAELGWSIAVAESLTGGLVVSSLVDVPGASRVLRGGVVAYATDLKHSVLGPPSRRASDGAGRARRPGRRRGLGRRRCGDDGSGGS